MLWRPVLALLYGPVACFGWLIWRPVLALPTDPVLWRPVLALLYGPVTCCGDLSWLYHMVLSSEQILATEGSYAQYPGNEKLCGPVEHHVLLCMATVEFFADWGAVAAV